MTSLWSVDPGAKFHAIAAFHNKVLQSVSFVDTYAIPDHVPDELVIEKMHVYKNELGAPARRHGNGGQKIALINSLFDVERAAGRLEAAVLARGGPRAKTYIPADWKGQLDKPTHHSRIWGGLSAAEKAAFAACSGHTVAEISEKIQEAVRILAVRGSVEEYSWMAHNLLDAVGIGRFHLGLIGKNGLARR